MLVNEWMMARLAVEYVCKQSRGLVLGNDKWWGNAKTKRWQSGWRSGSTFYANDENEVCELFFASFWHTKDVEMRNMDRFGCGHRGFVSCTVGNLMYLYTNTPKSLSSYSTAPWTSRSLSINLPLIYLSPLKAINLRIKIAHVAPPKRTGYVNPKAKTRMTGSKGHKWLRGSLA
jgi:hypothetical protein